MHGTTNLKSQHVYSFQRTLLSDADTGCYTANGQSTDQADFLQCFYKPKRQVTWQ